MLQVENMTLRQKVGQMFICGFPGIEPNDSIRGLIAEYGIGGVVLFRRNCASASQVRRLTRKLQYWSEQHGVPPLLVAIDQEGGMVARVENGATLVPGQMALGATGDPRSAYDVAGIIARELRGMGVNVNFAPCLDVNSNPANPVIGVRSFGESAELVADFGAAALLAYRETGVMAAVKHFPGHGDTATDSHHALPVVPHDGERLRALELVPFARAVREGADAVMTAHVALPAIDPSGAPATLSKPVLEGLLREELGFDGLIVTDCMEMSAIAERVGVAEGAVRAIEAGADLVLVSHTPERQKAALTAVLEAVECGRLPEARIDGSVRRILARKQALATVCEQPFSVDEHRRAAEHWSRRSVTLVRGGGLLPLDPAAPTLVVWTELREGTEVDEVAQRDGTLGSALAPFMPNVRELYVGLDPTAEEAAAVEAVCSECSQAVYVTYNASAWPRQAGLVLRLADRASGIGLKFAVASGRSPYDADAFPDVPIYIACYENRPLAMRSLAEVLLGETRAAGNSRQQ